MVACAKVIAFFCRFVVFSLLLEKHYKEGVFDDFEMLIFSFFGQKSRVNNLATVGLITWPHFCKTIGKMWPSYWPYSFHVFFVKTCFCSKISFSLQKEEYFWKTKKTPKNYKKGGQFIDLWWPSYWPYSIYIYIYYMYCFLHLIAWAQRPPIYRCSALQQFLMWWVFAANS